MSKQSLQAININSAAELRKKKAIKHAVNASHELQIIQNISVDQLKDLEQTYTYMLEAIKEARRSKQKADTITAEIIEHGKDYHATYNRRCLKVAWLWKRGKSSKEIDKIMMNKSGYCLNRSMAGHGKALSNELIREAKKRLVIKLVMSGHGIRPTSRDIPEALGKCSPALVIKIMKAEKMRQQPPLPMPLFSVK